jgi:predicted secreted protein
MRDFLWFPGAYRARGFRSKQDSHNLTQEEAFMAEHTGAWFNKHILADNQYLSSKRGIFYKTQLFRLWSSMAVVLWLISSPVWAGDIASYVDMGFSADGRTYMFAQYGVQAKTLRPWAELFVVDVPKNNFVSGGRVSFIHDSPVKAGQDGSGALYRIISRNTALTDRYGINYLLLGHTLYLSLDETDFTVSGETIEFQDFNPGISYKAKLVPSFEGSGGDLKSAFFINLERVPRDQATTLYTVGNPQVKRPLISSYRIKKVLTDPQYYALIFVIEMRKQGDTGIDIRYMVEAVIL